MLHQFHHPNHLVFSLQDQQHVLVYPEIDNPEYEEDPNLYLYKDLGVIGFDLWQVKSGTVFDNILITDSVKRAEEFGNETWGKTKDGEKKMKEKQDEEDRKKAEEESKKLEAEGKAQPTSDTEGDSDTEDTPPSLHDEGEL